MKKINLTPHEINIHNGIEEEIEVVPASGKEARLETTVDQTGDEDNHPWFQTVFGEPFLASFDKDGNEIERFPFPDEQSCVVYIVSGLFRSGFDRADFWQPGRLLRDSEGRPVGCVGLSR